MNRIEVLAALLEHCHEPVRGNAFGSPTVLRTFASARLVTQNGHVAVVGCPECSGLHEVETIDGSLGWICDAAGWIEAPAEDVAALTINVDRFVEMLGNQVDKPRRWAKPCDNPILWSLGSFTFGDHRVLVYFLLGPANLDRITEAQLLLRYEPFTDGIAVLTSDRCDLALSLPRSGRIVPMVECVEIDSDGNLALNREWLARRVLPEQLLHPAKRGRPNDAERMAAELIHELDQKRDLGKLGQNARHRELQAAAKARYGPSTTLSKEPCNNAWSTYIRNHPQVD